MLQIHGIIFSIVGENLLLHGHKMSYKVMEAVIQWCVSLENNNAHLKGKNNSYHRYLLFKKKLKMNGSQWKTKANWGPMEVTLWELDYPLRLDSNRYGTKHADFCKIDTMLIFDWLKI